MAKNKISRSALFIAGILIFGINACTYETIVPPKFEPPESISFSTDIVPIFDANCSLANCHATGAVNPDLTAANAYNSLTSGDYVDTSDPEVSLIYVKVAPGGSMEKYTDSGQDAVLILAWIKDGAQNN